jgi:hypothetical protein
MVKSIRCRSSQTTAANVKRIDCRWMPQVAGNYTLLARAVSQREQQQLKENHKDGSTGVLRIQVRLQG